MIHGTDFHGILAFQDDVTIHHIAKIMQVLEDFSLDLAISKDFKGLEHNSRNDTFDLTECVNTLIREVRNNVIEYLEGERRRIDFTSFTLLGEIYADNGFGAKYRIMIEQGEAIVKENWKD